MMVHGITAKKRSRFAEMTPFGIDTAVFAAAVGVPGRHNTSDVVSPERCLSGSGHKIIVRDCRGGTSSGIATSSFA